MSDRPSEHALREAERRDDLFALIRISRQLAEVDRQLVWGLSGRLLERARAAREESRSAPELDRPELRHQAEALAAAALTVLAALGASQSTGNTGRSAEELYQRYVDALRIWKPIEWSLWLAGHGWRVLSHVGYGLVDLLGWKESRIAGDGKVRLGEEFPPMPAVSESASVFSSLPDDGPAKGEESQAD